MDTPSRTAVIVDAVLETDPAVPVRTRRRIAELLSFCREPVKVDGEDLLGEREAARILGCSHMTLYRWRTDRAPHMGPFPFTVIRNPAGRVRYLRADVQQWRDRNCRRAVLAPVLDPDAA